MNSRTRRAALQAIGAIALAASVNALAHSYAGLYDWAVHHRLGGWQAMSWPAEIDVFLAVGELALYVAYLDGWPARQRMWPWATALTGLAVSIAGNIGHIKAVPGHPVILADRLTAATSLLAAFAGLSVGLLVLKMTRRRDRDLPGETTDAAAPGLPARTARAGPHPSPAALAIADGNAIQPDCTDRCENGGAVPAERLLEAANAICLDAAERGERLSQRMLARQLRSHGHRFPNEHLRHIANCAGLTTRRAA